MSVSDTIAQEALVVNAAAQWKPSKGSHDCAFELSPMTSYDRRGFRVSTIVEPCSIEALDLLFSTPGNNKLFEPAITSEITIEDDEDDRSRLVHTKFGQQGIVSARDFVTRQVSRLVDKDFSSAVEKLLLTESGGGATAAASGKVFIFATKSTDDDRRIPSQPNVVRGCVYMHAFIGVPLFRRQQSGGDLAIPSTAALQQTACSAVKLLYVSCVDPRGSIPVFALESSWSGENCAKLARIRDLAILIENLMTNAKRVERHLLLSASRSPVATAPCRAEEVVSVQVLGDRKSLPVPVAGAATDGVDDDGKKKRSTVRSTLKPLPDAAPPTPTDEAAAEPMSPAVPTDAIPTINKMIDLYKHNGWTVSKTLDNCLLEDMPAPFAPDRKVLRISTTFNCTLGTFCEFLADVSQVRKYDPMLESFDVVDDTPAGIVLYTSYKQQTRLVAPRDFCTMTAKAELNSADADAHGLPPCAGAYVQCSVNSAARPPVKQFTRGIVHVFGYVAIAERDSSIGRGASQSGVVATPTIKVHNILCVDPSGSVPKWLVDAASAESCKKLALIRKLCEDRQRSAPGAAPRRLSMRRTVAPSIPPRGSHQHADPVVEGAPTDGEGSGDGSDASSQFHSCIDENEILNEQENLRGFYEKEIQEVVEHVILLHRASGWEVQKTENDIRLETMQTSFCDKKAIKIGCEFKCSLETFRTVISSIDYIRKYNTTLNEMEPLDSPPYGTVMHTTYTSSTKLFQPRDFCTLTAAKLLSDDEGSDAGLYTKGFHAAAFVISSINATDKPPQPGYIRGTVHAHGYIAVAVPPDAQRIRVFNVSLVDPMGSIPAKLVNIAVADTVKQMDVIRGICEGVHLNGVAGARAANQAASSATSSAPSDFPAIDEVPILRKLARVHVSTSDWRDLRHLGKVQAMWAPTDVNPDVPVLKFATEFMCTLDAFARFVSTSDHLRKSDPELDTVKFLNGPPNATIGYVSHSSHHKALPGVDLVQMTVNKMFTGDEGSEMGLYTKGIRASAFVVNAINWSTKELAPPLKDASGHELHRATVLYNGYVAIATPPDARRIRVFAYLSLGGVSALKCAGTQQANKPKDAIMAEFANRMSRMSAFCEQVQRDIDAAAKAPGGLRDDSQNSQEEEEVMEETSQLTPPQSDAASSTAAAETAPVVTRAQLDICAKLLDLHRRRDWVMGKVVDRCLLESIAVPFCSKKGLRISADFNCSLRTLSEFLDDTSQVRVLDPGLDTFDIVGTSEVDKTVHIYTSYQQQVRLIAPRDFFTTTTRMLLEEHDVSSVPQIACVVPEGHCVLIQNSKSINGHPAPEGKKLVRGFVHVHGFFATAPTVHFPKIRVFNISCVDPSGSIPNWVVEAANAEACKKLGLIRQLCEERQRRN